MPSAVPRFPVYLAIAAAVLTMGMKAAAYWWTGSVGLLSDAAESLVNLLAAVTAGICLWYAARPVDATHTYGHEKIEFFSAGLEAILIVVAAGGIAWVAIERLIHFQPLAALGLGTAIAVAASLINLGVALILLRVGRAHRSILLEAGGHHLLTDVWTSAGVVAGLGLVWLTGWEVLDPIMGLVVAANIVWTAFHLLRRSFDGLMDHALPQDEQAQVRSAIAALLPAGVTFHALRSRQAGPRRFLDFHLLVPGAWSVQKAHDLTEQVEQVVRATLAGSEVTVHIEPIEAQESWHDSDLLRLEQPAPPNPL